MNVELLRFKFPNIYDLLVSKWNYFLTIKDEYHTDQLVLWSEAKNKQTNLFTYVNTTKIELKKYIIENLDILGVREQRVEDVMIIINTMFPEYGSLQGGIKKINNVNAIRRYFYYTLLDSDLSGSDFNQLWSLPYDKIKQRIDGMIVSKSRSLVTQIDNRIPNGTEEYMKFVKAIFYIGSISKGWVNDNDDITRFLSMNSFFDSNDKHKHFVIDTLSENWDNEFALRYLQSIYKNTINNWDYMLTKEEIIDLNLDFFKMHLKVKQSIEKCLYYLHFTTYINWIPAVGGGFTKKTFRNKKADLLLIEYSKSNIESLIYNLIKKASGENSLYYIDKYAKTIWESWENFEKFILDINNKSSIVLEFIRFMELCKENDYTQGISFEFKELTAPL